MNQEEKDRAAFEEAWEKQFPIYEKAPLGLQEDFIKLWQAALEYARQGKSEPAVLVLPEISEFILCEYSEQMLWAREQYEKAIKRLNPHLKIEEAEE